VRWRETTARFWSADGRITTSARIIELAQQAGDSSLEIAGHGWRLADLFEMGDIPGADREIDSHESLAARTRQRLGSQQSSRSVSVPVVRPRKDGSIRIQRCSMPGGRAQWSRSPSGPSGFSLP
jgi:hypothetical protein